LQDVLSLLEELLRRIAEEIAGLAPRLFLALSAILATAVLIKLINAYLRRLLSFSRLDEAVERTLGRPPLPPSSLIVGLADLGVGLIGAYVALTLLLPEELVEAFDSAVVYVGRTVSVLALIGFILVAFNALVGRIRLEAKLKSYMAFFSFLMATALLVDVVALSDPVKQALVSGLAIGIGASIAVFALWFFFSDYIERCLRLLESSHK